MSTLRRRNAIPATLMHMSANGTGLGTYGRGRRPSRRLRAFSYRYVRGRVALAKWQHLGNGVIIIAARVICC